PAQSWKELPYPLSGADAKAVADVAPGVAAAEAADFLVRHLQRRSEPPEAVVRYVHHIARFGSNRSVRAVVAFARADRPSDSGHQVALLRAIAEGLQARGTPPTPALRQWTEELTGKLLASKEQGQLLAGIELCGSLKVPSMQKQLAAKAMDHELPEGHRRAAVVALVRIDPRAHVQLFGRLLENGSE